MKIIEFSNVLRREKRLMELKFEMKRGSSRFNHIHEIDMSVRKGSEG
jgi:hypothetical protein